MRIRGEVAEFILRGLAQEYAARSLGGRGDLFGQFAAEVQDETIIVERKRLQRGRGETTARGEHSKVRKVQGVHEGVGYASPHKAVDTPAMPLKCRPVIRLIIQGRSQLYWRSRHKLPHTRPADCKVQFICAAEHKVPVTVRIQTQPVHSPEQTIVRVYQCCILPMFGNLPICGTGDNEPVEMFERTIVFP